MIKKQYTLEEKYEATIAALRNFQQNLGMEDYQHPDEKDLYQYAFQLSVIKRRINALLNIIEPEENTESK